MEANHNFRILRNGLTVHTIQRRELPIVFVMLLYPVGSGHERTSEFGMAHFLEHMMFKGSQNFPQGTLDLFSHRSGGENNAYTSRDFTVFYHVLPSRHWQKALEMEFDRMTGLIMDPVEYESEKRVVLEELAMYEDEPSEALYDFHFAQAFDKAHPYQHPIIGTREILGAQTVEDMQAFYRAHYQIDNATLVLLGDIDHVQALRSVEKLTEGISQGNPLQKIELIQRGLYPGQKQIKVLEQDVEVFRISLSFPSNCSGDTWEAASAVFEEAMAGGRSSRLVKTLREELQVAQSLNLFSDSHLLGGRQIIEVEVSDDVDPRTCLRQVLNQLRELHERPFSKKDLEQGQTRALASHLFDQERLENLGYSFAQWLSVGKPMGYFDFDRLLKELDFDVIPHFISKFYDPGKMTLGVSCPVGEGKIFQNLEIADLWS